jgi:PAS domain-containing protein
MILFRLRVFFLEALEDSLMGKKLTPKQLEQKVRILEKEVAGHKQTEEQLLEYKEAIEASPDMMAIVDRKYTYRMVNQAFLEYRKKKEGQIIGHTIEEVLGKDVFEGTVKPKLKKCGSSGFVVHNFKPFLAL